MPECERNQIVYSETLKWERDRVVRYTVSGFTGFTGISVVVNICLWDYHCTISWKGNIALNTNYKTQSYFNLKSM
jgi:hypothetical protein